MRGIKQEVFDDLVPIQIIGTQRSGSNLLRVMLSQLHGVFAPHPPHILRTFIPLIPYYGDLEKRENYYELVRDMCEFVRLNPVPWLNSQLDAEVIVDYSREHSLLEAYRKIHELNAISNKARFWFNKSMQNVYYMDFFEKKGFKPYLIHLIRDGRDVALSFKNTIIGHKHIYPLAEQWRQDQEESNVLIEKYAPDRAIRVSYEDLLRQPELEIQRICQFIGLEYSNNILKFYESPDSKVTAESGEMWHNLSKPLIKDNFNKYKSGLSREEILIFEKVAGSLLQQYGYALEDKGSVNASRFSRGEILEFNTINEKMKKEVLSRATEKDLRKRHDQEEFINGLKKRKGVHIPV